MSRKPLSPAAVAALNHRLRIIAERLEQRRVAAAQWGEWVRKCDELARQCDEQRREIERVFPSEVTL